MRGWQTSKGRIPLIIFFLLGLDVMLRRARTSLIGEHRRKQVLYNTFSKDRALGLITYVASAGSAAGVAYSMGLRSVEQYLRGYDKDVAFEVRACTPTELRTQATAHGLRFRSESGSFASGTPTSGSSLRRRPLSARLA